MDTFRKTSIAIFCVLMTTIGAGSHAFAQEPTRIEFIEMFDNTDNVTIGEDTRMKLANFNNDLYASSRLEIVSVGGVVKNMSEKTAAIKNTLGEEGIPTKELKMVTQNASPTLSQMNLKAGFLYLVFNAAEKKAYTKGMNPISMCQTDTLVEFENNYGLYYNKCDFDDKKQLPAVKVWGMEAHNGYYNETPAKAKDFYVKQVLTVFTVLRNDSDDVPDGVVIPMEAGVIESNLTLEQYLPRAYKWIQAKEVTTGIIKRNRRNYLFADLENSGHYRFVTEPMKTASVFFIDAPENMCFKEIIIDQGPSKTYKGTLFNGKTRAAFITPTNPVTYNCSIRLIDREGHETTIENRPLESLADNKRIPEKSKSQFKFDLPGYKTVTAQSLYTLSLSKKNHNKPLYSNR